MAWTIKITSNRMKLKLFHWLKSTATKRNGFFHARVVRPCPIRFVQWIFVSTQMFHIFICLNWLFSWMSISIDGIFSFDFSLEMCFSVIVVVVHIIYRRKTNNEIAFAQKKRIYSTLFVCRPPRSIRQNEVIMGWMLGESVLKSRMRMRLISRAAREKVVHIWIVFQIHAYK